MGNDPISFNLLFPRNSRPLAPKVVPARRERYPQRLERAALGLSEHLNLPNHALALSAGFDAVDSFKELFERVGQLIFRFFNRQASCIELHDPANRLG